MVQKFVITPYPPELWSEANVAKYGEPTSSLQISELELEKIKILKPNWYWNMQCLFVDGELSLCFACFDMQFLIIEIFQGFGLNQVIYEYRHIVPTNFDLYLFYMGDDRSLKLETLTTIDEIARWTGYI